MAFTKDRDPSDTKFAMIDRSVAHMVRSIGKSAHTDNEFKNSEKSIERFFSLKPNLGRFRFSQNLSEGCP